MYIHETEYRVRYADTDQMGYMYYGNYARLYEIARVEAFRSLGYSYKEMEDSGVLMPVYENHSRFIAPALYDEMLTIRTTLKVKPAVRSIFNYEIFNEKKALIHTGETTLVFLHKDNNRLVPAPATLLQKLEPFFT